MGKRKIYWWIQQIDDIGGTEMVSINLANQLSDKFDVTLFVTSEIKNKIVYEINPNIKIINLGFKKEFVRFDQCINLYKKNHQYLKALKLAIHSFNTIVFKKRKIRKRIANYIDSKEDILIASSFESYLFSPKVSKLYFHFHFDDRNFFSFVSQFAFRHSNKPYRFIFLSNNIRNKIIEKNKKYEEKSISIINPVRFSPSLNLDFHNNHIIFVGRYVEQKDPLLALRIINELKNKNLPFHFDMYGKGPYQQEMDRFINEKKLNDYVTINSPTNNIKEIYKEADLLLMTSKHEGVVLSKIEANAFSVPCVLRNWGTSIKDIAGEKESIIIEGENPSDYADKITKLLTSEELISYKKESYEYSKQFDIKNIIPIWEELFNK